MNETTPAELVHYEAAAGIATITLDSPHNRNALSTQLVTELDERLERAASDGDVRVVLLQSSAKVFCSGADLSEAATVPMVEGTRRIVALQRRIATLDVPVVTKNLGAVRAGGIGIVAAADVAIGASESSFALTEVKLGLTPAVISLTVFHRMTSRGAALAALGGEVFSGSQAAEWGLLTRAVPAEQLDEEVAAICASLASGAAQGLRETKRLLNADLVARIDAGGEELSQLSARLFGSDEAREAMTAFLSRGR